MPAPLPGAVVVTVPVATKQVGWVVTLAVGAAGVAFMVTVFVELQPVLVSVKVRTLLPAVTPVTKPASVTDAFPFELLHVPPVVGVTVIVLPTHTALGPPNVGLAGSPVISMLADAAEVHPAALVTVNVYVPLSGKLLIVVLAVLPVVVTLPGVLVTVQLPLGKPLNTTLPVGVVHVGWVIAPTIGAVTTGQVKFITAVPVFELCFPAASIALKGIDTEVAPFAVGSTVIVGVGAPLALVGIPSGKAD